MFAVAIAIIAVVSRYNSMYLNQSYSKEFGMMFVFSLGVAAVSFIIGYFLNKVL